MCKNSLIIGISLYFLSVFNVFAQDIVPGAVRTRQYFPMLEGKRIGVVANHTSLIKQTHLVDSLLGAHIDIKYIFSPEHGFRGKADAGKHIPDAVDIKTGLPVISLYGSQKKPHAKYFDQIDYMIFDLQDVGVRFYTYISTLHYVMEACAENHTPLLVLDRPNPNGFYIDGPVLESAHKSFVGMHPIPVVHGITIAELALMINGERWIEPQCELEIVKCENYTHEMLYDLPVAPSPNLPNMQAVYLYPSLGLLEGTVMSVGRGTPYPFQLYGHPKYSDKGFSFVPLPGRGASDPKYKGQKCYGVSLQTLIEGNSSIPGIRLRYIMDSYLKTDTSEFFNSFFTLLAGTNNLQQQIEQGKSAKQIKKSWEPALETYSKMRDQYLLYDDFE